MKTINISLHLGILDLTASFAVMLIVLIILLLVEKSEKGLFICRRLLDQLCEKLRDMNINPWRKEVNRKQWFVESSCINPANSQTVGFYYKKTAMRYARFLSRQFHVYRVIVVHESGKQLTIKMP